VKIVSGDTPFETDEISETKTYGSSSYSQERQNAGICCGGMATPQNSEKVMMMNGLKSTAMKVLGVSAEIICPSVTENSSVIRTTRK
jgi:hypothetical protein